MEEALLWSGGIANCEAGDLLQVKGKLNRTGDHSVLQHHTIPSGTQLVAQGFLLIQDNDPKHTNKLCQRYIQSKEEQHVLHLTCWLTQSADLNPMNWFGMILTDKAERHASSDFCRKVRKNYLLSISSL